MITTKYKKTTAVKAVVKLSILFFIVIKASIRGFFRGHMKYPSAFNTNVPKMTCLRLALCGIVRFSYCNGKLVCTGGGTSAAGVEA